MALDGIAISNIVRELNGKLQGGKVDKIYQPQKDEIVLGIRCKGENYKLLLTANPSAPRIHLTEASRENPIQAPLFSMTLRKHLTGGRVISFEQPDFERIVRMRIEALNEMGDPAVKEIMIEIMGKHSNIILINEKGIIIDAIKRVSFATSSVREVLPGKDYVFPPSQNKSNPLFLNREDFKKTAAAHPGLTLQKLIYQNYTGVSPIAASEIVHRAGMDSSEYGGQWEEGKIERLYAAFAAFMGDIQAGAYSPRIIYDNKLRPLEFGVFSITCMEGEVKNFLSPSEMLEVFYGQKDSQSRVGQKSQDIRRLVQVNIERCVKKKDMQQKTWEEISGRDTLRLYGELITANIYGIQQGETGFKTVNFYDENLPEIHIPLDSAKTPTENAQAYFKKYAKQKRTYEALQSQMAQNEEELAYLEGVMESLISSTEEGDIREIREELAEQGFIKRRKQDKGAPKAKKAKPLHYVTSDGFHIYVGKNNKQNDELTLRFASSEDIWMHTKDIPGSHVILKTEGKEPSNVALEEGANLAAFHSKARNGSLVPVDYARRKHVKKPGGAKPGMVIYENNKTAYVTPDEGKINALTPGD